MARLFFEQVAKYFMNVFETHHKFLEVLGSWERGETQMREFVKTDVRQKTVQCIRKASENDEKTLEILKQLVEVL